VRWLLRISGALFLALALGLFLRDLADRPEGAPLVLSSLGEIWYAVDPGSLNLLQALVQRYLSPDLWDAVLVDVLLWPALWIFLLPGLLLLVLGFLPRRAGR